MVDTIERICYNMAERTRLYAEYEDIRRKIESMNEYFDSVLDNVTDEEFDELTNKIYEMNELSKHAYLKCFAAQFPKCRNKWFCDIILGMQADGITHKRISRRQNECFSRYTKGDKDNWKTNETYCRVGNMFVTLYSNDGASYFSIDIQEL